MLGHKAHHHRKHRETGGRNDAETDLAEKPEARDNAHKIEGEAAERKRGGKAEAHPKGCRCGRCMGGRAGRKAGGAVHHEKMEDMKHAKHVGPVHGDVKHHAGRKPRKNGGRTGSDSAPFSSARKGSDPVGHKTEIGMD